MTPTWAPAARERAGLVGVARRRIKALPGGRRQHWCRQRGKGLALLAWPDEGLRLCRQGDANMGWRQAGFGAPCCVARRRSKALRAGRRQHGRRRREKRRSLLAWPDEGLRLCRQGDANMGAGRAGKGGPCWRAPTMDYGFASRATPTWAGARRDSGRPVGVARRKTKALPGGRRQHRLR